MRLNRLSLSASLLALPLLLLLVLPPRAQAADPILSKFAGKNIDLSVSGGWLGFNPDPSGRSDWEGVDISPAVTLSLHPSFAVAFNYDHGFAFSKGASGIDQATLQGQLRVYPPIGYDVTQPHPDGLYASAGPIWQGSGSFSEFSGLNAQIAASHFFTERAFLFAKYAHAFPWNHDKSAENFYRVGVGIGSPLGQ